MSKESKQTLVIVLITVSLCFINNAMSQPYLGLGLTNSGGLVQLGAIADKVEISASYKRPFTKNDVNKVLSFQVGRQILLSHNESDNYSVTPLLGYAYLSRKDYTAYDHDPTGKTPILQVTKYTPIYSVELGKDAYMGRMFLVASYSENLYFGVGIKMFTNR